jgi:hypothetical protein
MALFMVDDVAERAVGEAASRSHEGVWATLSKLGEVATVVAWLGTEAQCQMIDEVVVQAPMGLLIFYSRYVCSTFIVVA